ncbi:hypothetical protein CEP88_00240 (plasmid) [Roseobacter denitrificans]|uniref:Putative VirB10 protein n=1 Tax=Roseobacter denitrificans (strain ATCC 33942 / OCh 114) TaxID=375451 RepID=Q07GT7_ROSDO|nr:TrbI/VirB10 family protein [Roseobacter denitrificans]ABI93312.1 putative VirB10 protein [Roseobacter denitrificans OCh 114]AVL51224.1 hypothetical protein CEP88_00240 [Roseobacter denitrificans]SFG40532.1 type IV secretion system protein VirB10 [Roseobacter denitrificans OCh 114]
MTDDPNTVEARVADRQARLAGGQPRNTMRTVAIAGGVLAFILLAAVLLAQDQMRALFSGTSDSEDFQRTSTADPGLSTQMTVPQQVQTDVTEPLDTTINMPAPSDPALVEQAEGNAELAALQAQLDELIAAQGQQGVDPDALNDLLDAQAARLQEEFDNQARLQEQLYQQQLQAARAAAVPTGPNPNDIAEQEARQRLEEERARRAAIREEQIRSPALLFDGGGPAGAASGGTGSRDLNANESFLQSASRQPHETAKAGSIPNPSRTIVQGTIIEAVLETALSTELPGTLRAVTSVDVYSFDGSTVLMPKGTRLIGSYSSEVTLAQSRALIAWNRAITPDGRSVSLGGIGGDRLGRSGQTGFVDTRFGERFGSAALISVLGIAPSLVIDDNSSNAQQELAEDLGDDLRNTTASVLNDYLSLPPIIYVDQGAELTVFVDRDLVF